jgi:hypothetical protein
MVANVGAIARSLLVLRCEILISDFALRDQGQQTLNGLSVGGGVVFLNDNALECRAEAKDLSGLGIIGCVRVSWSKPLKPCTHRCRTSRPIWR